MTPFKAIQFCYLKSQAFWGILGFVFFLTLWLFFPSSLYIWYDTEIQNKLNKRRKQSCEWSKMPIHCWLKPMGITIFWPFAVEEHSVLTSVGEAYQTKRCFHFAYKLKWAWTWLIVRLTLKSPHSSSQMDVYCCMCVCSAQKGENEGNMLEKAMASKDRTERKARAT